MTFQELLRTVSYDGIWTVLQTEYDSDNHHDAYLVVVERLKAMQPKDDGEQGTLFIERFFFEDDNIVSDDDVYVVFANDESRYSPMLMPWAEWLPLTADEKSVEYYGAAAFAAHALYELTFFGFTEEDLDEERASINESVREFEETLKNGTKPYTEEEYAALMVDVPTWAEYKKREQDNEHL
ncbi:MAG: hypothetical protein LBN00_12175 [Oscillospiraceae bacterium]|jgi:hypothetical protein|nr:hypothetical protein [Oscillospiraceae bacterium]